MLKRSLNQAPQWSNRAVCLFCAARSPTRQSQFRSFNATGPLLKRRTARRKSAKDIDAEKLGTKDAEPGNVDATASAEAKDEEEPQARKKKHATKDQKELQERIRKQTTKPQVRISKHGSVKGGFMPIERKTKTSKADKLGISERGTGDATPMSLKQALMQRDGPLQHDSKKAKKKKAAELNIETMHPVDLNFEAIPKQIPPVPMLSYGLDRVLFNPGVYLLQDPRSRIYNFDPYLEKVMPVDEFNFDALSEYKTSSKDTELLNLTSQLGTKFTGSTSSMSGVLQHFHYLLSNFRELDHQMLSRAFPDKSRKFSKISHRPNAVFLRYKNGIYAIDADKSFDTPNIMSWLGHSLEKLLTSDRGEFELYRRSNTEKAPSEDDSSRCYHYSKLGNFLMRSQLDAYDPRLPGSGVFDLKTRAVVSIRMNASEYEAGSGYQLRYAQGEWESYEREFYDMTRATMLKYSLQVRMGRMDGIFVAYHNIERIFGFQYLSLPDLDRVLHGQTDTTLGDQEFKLSLGLLDELLAKAVAQFPETSIRLHVEARDAKTPFMYVFAEPVTEEEADEIQGAGDAAQKDFARTVVGITRGDTDQEAWQSMQENVDEQLDKDGDGKSGVAHQLEEDQVNDDAIVKESKSVAEAHTDEVSSETDLADEDSVEEEAQEDVSEETTEGTNAENNKPLIGWTLTVRSKVNGGYVDRPVNLNQNDDWKIEYHVSEIPEKSRWRIYNSVKERRRGLSVMEGKEVDSGLQAYRNLIQRYSDRGRKWRTEQDIINADKGVEMYKALGPGSEAAAEGSVEQKEQ